MSTTINLMAERPTTVRFRPDINAAIRDVAEELGISFNAALSVLVVEALKVRGQYPRLKDGTSTGQRPDSGAHG